MATLENINDIIESKIKLTKSLYSLLEQEINNPNIQLKLNNLSLDDKFSNDSYILKKNINNLYKNKELVCNSIEDYEITSAHFVFIYNKIILLDEIENKPDSYKDIENYYNSIEKYSISNSYIKHSITELLSIYKNNHYEYKSVKTIGNKINSKKDSFDIKNRLKKIYEEYKTYIIKSNINDTLDRFVNLIQSFFKTYIIQKFSDEVEEITTNLFSELINKYNRIYFSIGKDESEICYDVCECGNKMIVQSNTSELLCVRCGYTMYLIGSVTEENQLFAQEGNRVSHGSYDPARHCKFWIERIQAKESTIIPDEYIEKIRKSIKKDRIENTKSISVKQFRSYLKQNNLSRLNDHIPLIKKIITGYIPPQLSYNEQQLLFIYFDKATKTYERIKPANKKNSLYYPFLIYKILDLIIKDENKKSKLLSCIHLQSYDTLIDNDRIWNLICQNNSCFEYRATDKIDFS